MSIEDKNHIQHTHPTIINRTHNDYNKLTCVLCNRFLDNNTQKHKCFLRPKHKDIILIK